MAELVRQVLLVSVAKAASKAHASGRGPGMPRDRAPHRSPAVLRGGAGPVGIAHGAVQAPRDRQLQEDDAQRGAQVPRALPRAMRAMRAASRRLPKAQLGRGEVHVLRRLHQDLTITHHHARPPRAGDHGLGFRRKKKATGCLTLTLNGGGVASREPVVSFVARPGAVQLVTCGKKRVGSSSASGHLWRCYLIPCPPAIFRAQSGSLSSYVMRS